ncbi:MAG TPA: hypothetical protein VI819_03305 [Patescibacteria group bacterium]|nr:hypothetical protein [Patescibacteria group bacterium]
MQEQKIIGLDNSVLEEIIRGGGGFARQALEELSGRAMGGNPDARSLVMKIDNEVSSGHLTLPTEEVKPENNTISLKDRLKSAFNRQGKLQHFLPPDRDP